MKDTKANAKQRYGPKTLVGEALAVDPTLKEVLMEFHIGGCSMCGFDEGDTIAEVAEANGVPVEVLVAAMNRQK